MTLERWQSKKEWNGSKSLSDKVRDTKLSSDLTPTRSGVTPLPSVDLCKHMESKTCPRMILYQNRPFFFYGNVKSLTWGMRKVPKGKILAWINTASSHPNAETFFQLADLDG